MIEFYLMLDNNNSGKISIEEFFKILEILESTK